MAITPPVPVFSTEFWDSFLPHAAPFIRVVRGHLDSGNRSDYDAFIWEDFQAVIQADRVPQWLVELNVYAREGFTAADWDALVAWNGGRYAWKELALALMWAAVSNPAACSVPIAVGT